MPPSVADVIRLVYELSVVDKGTKKLVGSEREIQKETKQTTRTLKEQDAAVRRSAQVAEQAARRETAAARRTATARRRAADPGLLRRGAAGAAGGVRGAVGAVAGFATIAGARKAVSTTEALAKATLQLHGAFGLAVEDASRWAAIITARGGEPKQLAMGFKTLATQARAASQGVGKQGEALDALRAKNAMRIAQAEEDASRMKDQGDARRKLTRVTQAAAAAEDALGKKSGTQAKIFERLGITQQELVKHGNDTNWMLHAVSDGLAALPSKTEKSAIAAKLFGRSWMVVAPLIRDGSKAMDANLALADKYGATLGVKNVAELKKLIAAQREAKLASLGLQIAFGTKVAPTLTMIINKTAAFAAQMRSGEGAGGRFAKRARAIADDLRPVGDALKQVGGFLVEHPRLVVAAAGAYAAFKAARGTLRIVNDIRAIGTAIGAVARRAAKTRLATALADGAKGAGGAVRRALAGVDDVVAGIMRRAGRRGGATAAASTAESLATQLPVSTNAREGRFAKAGRAAGRAFGRGLILGVVAAAPLLITEFQKKVSDLLGLGGAGAENANRARGVGPGAAWDAIKKLAGFRRGGPVSRYAGGGVVPIMAAGGELIVDATGSTMVPGDPRRDATPMWAPAGAAVLTADGQARVAGGSSVRSAIATQAPHFAKGGLVGSFRATAYGPPWGGIQGGGTTATGVNLRRSPHIYGVAVDPSVIPLGTQVYAWPNPFGRSGPFRAFDTGGAIKGNRLDFYDWRGRASQNKWGSKVVRVSRSRIHAVGRGPAAGGGEDVTARIPLSLSPSRVRAGLVADALEQGIAAGAAGLTRGEIRSAAAGGRGARRNPIIEAIAGAMTPSFREVTIPGKDAGSGGGAGGATGPLPGGVTVPKASWNPAKRPIARWIVPYLSWAASSTRAGSGGPARRGAGGGRWSGMVTSGYRSVAEQRRIYNSGVRPAARPGQSNHQGTAYPRGAVDVTKAAELSQVLRGKPGPHLLSWAGAKDPVHFSHPHGGSYRRGGVVGGRLGTALTGAMSFKGGSFDALDAIIGQAAEGRLAALRRDVLRRVRAGGDKRTIQRLQGVIDLVDFEIGRRIGRIQDVVEQRTARLERVQGAADRALRLAGLDPASPRGLAVMGRVQGAETGIRRQNIASLTRALATARRTGNREVIRDIEQRLAEAQDALAESLVRQVEIWRDQLRAVGAEAVNQAQFRLGLTQSVGSILEAGQRAAGKQDTPAAMLARAQYTAGAVIPALEQQKAASLFAARIAAATGDLDGWRAAVQDAAGAAVDIANAQADAADLIRAAAARAAQDIVDAATHQRTMADMGLQRLELEQQLIGTFEGTGGAQGRADFIKGQIIPAIQGEIAALRVQQQTAQLAGDQALATQIAEAIYAKENDVLQSQLDAMNAVKDNTDLLRDFGGSLAFSYQGQVQTDLDVIRARAGA